MRGALRQSLAEPPTRLAAVIFYNYIFRSQYWFTLNNFALSNSFMFEIACPF